MPAQNSPGPSAGFSELIYRYTVVGAVKASIDTGVDPADAGTNDWSNGDLLEIFILAENDGASTEVDLTFNNDSGANYDRMDLTGVGTSTISQGVALAETSCRLYCKGSGNNYASTLRLSIQAYARTVFYKNIVVVGVAPDTTAANAIYGGRQHGYRSTSAITRAKLLAGGGQNLAIGSQLLIYKRLAA